MLPTSTQPRTRTIGCREVAPRTNCANRGIWNLNPLGNLTCVPPLSKRFNDRQPSSSHVIPLCPALFVQQDYLCRTGLNVQSPSPARDSPRSDRTVESV